MFEDIIGNVNSIQVPNIQNVNYYGFLENISNLPSGLYCLEFDSFMCHEINNSNFETWKIVIENNKQILGGIISKAIKQLKLDTWYFIRYYDNGIDAKRWEIDGKYINIKIGSIELINDPNILSKLKKWKDNDMSMSDVWKYYDCYNWIYKPIKNEKPPEKNNDKINKNNLDIR